MYERAHAAASLTLGSNSSRHMTNASRAPDSTTEVANWVECLATALRTNAAAFLKKRFYYERFPTKVGRIVC